MRCHTWSSRLWVRGARQPLVELGQGGLEAGGETLDDASFLLGPLLGVAVQAHLVGVGRDHLVQVHGLLGLGLERDGGLGVELTVRFAADDQIAVVVLTQPLHAGLGGDAAVHDHEGAGWRRQRFEHAGQRALFADVAGEDLGAAHEAAGVEHQAQGQQRTVAALLLRVPAFCLRLLARLALEVGVGQVVEGHRRLAVEEPHRAVEQMRLDRLAMLHQRVRGAVELHRTDGFEVDAEQLPEAAARLQPAVRRTLRGGLSEAPDNDAGRRRAQGAVDAQLGEQGRQAQLLQRPQAELLDPDAAGTDQTQRVDIDPLHVGRFGGRPVPRCTAREQLRGDALGLVLDGGRALGEQGRLAGQDVVDASAQRRPLGLGDVEVAPEIEQGALADGVSDALGVHQAMGEVGFSVLGPAGLCASNEHAAHDSGRGGRSQPIQYDYGTTSRTVKTRSFRINNLQTWQSRNTAKIGKMAGQLGKLGLGVCAVEDCESENSISPRISSLI